MRGWTFGLASFLDLREVQNVTVGQQELLHFVFRPVELAALLFPKLRSNLSVRNQLESKSVP